MAQPQVSVLISCYNSAAWLGEAISSLQSQTLREIEIIAINDGSTDATLSILERTAEHDQRIRVIDKPNTGLADSLNQGAALANGQWLARLDADDIAEPERLERQLAFALAHPDVGLIGTGCTEINADGSTIKVHTYPAEHKELVARMQRLLAFFPHSSTFFRRDLFLQLGGYRPQIRRAEDIDLWLRMSERTQIACLPAPLVRLRKHEAQISHADDGKRQLIDAYAAVACHYVRMADRQDPLDLPISQAGFFRFVESEMERSNIFRSAALWQTAKAQFRSAPSRVSGIIRMGLTIAGSGVAHTVIDARFRGATLPRKIAMDRLRA